jgi:hypothetical protein
VAAVATSTGRVEPRAEADIDEAIEPSPGVPLPETPADGPAPDVLEGEWRPADQLPPATPVEPTAPAADADLEAPR